MVSTGYRYTATTDCVLQIPATLCEYEATKKYEVPGTQAQKHQVSRVRPKKHGMDNYPYLIGTHG